MEDRHMILHDLNTMFNIQVKIPGRSQLFS